MTYAGATERIAGWAKAAATNPVKGALVWVVAVMALVVMAVVVTVWQVVMFVPRIAVADGLRKRNKRAAARRAVSETA
jgi:hypothetical protein